MTYDLWETYIYSQSTPWLRVEPRIQRSRAKCSRQWTISLIKYAWKGRTGARLSYVLNTHYTWNLHHIHFKRHSHLKQPFLSYPDGCQGYAEMDSAIHMIVQHQMSFGLHTHAPYSICYSIGGPSLFDVPIRIRRGWNTRLCLNQELAQWSLILSSIDYPSSQRFTP